jgi:hypothetical protein
MKYVDQYVTDALISERDGGDLNLFYFYQRITTFQEAGINRRVAQTIGIAVDHRRTNKCTESLKQNADRLKEYKARLVIFPRRNSRAKKGDASKAEIAEAKSTINVNVVPAVTDAVTFAPLTEVIYFPCLLICFLH